MRATLIITGIVGAEDIVFLYDGEVDSYGVNVDGPAFGTGTSDQFPAKQTITLKLPLGQHPTTYRKPVKVGKG
jgi:hypothetical protein